MANSKLLKEAIADAKAVRETAIANAKIALEEAFTPRLQSILSRKLQAEMEDEELDGAEDLDNVVDTDDVVDEPTDVDAVEDDIVDTEDDVEEADTSGIGTSDNKEPSAISKTPHTDIGDTEEETSEPGNEDDNTDVVDTLDEEDDGIFADPTNADDAELTLDEEDDLELDDDELDLESIIRELEAEVDDEVEPDMTDSDDEELDIDIEDDEIVEDDDEEIDIDIEDDDEEIDIDIEDDEVVENEDEELDLDDEIDLDEILREMGYGDEGEEEVPEELPVEDDEEVVEMRNNIGQLRYELDEAYDTIKTLKSTINEVNLLNAKLLYANRLFRTYNLNNEQKTKIVENLDRTSSVREVKLVYATLAESMNFTGTERKQKRNISEGVSSKKVSSTKPTQEIITENVDDMADRFQRLAGIIKS